MILLRLTVILAVCAFCALPVLHSVLVFPGAIFGTLIRWTGGKMTVPPGVQARTITTPDGAKLDVWYLPPAVLPSSTPNANDPLAAADSTATLVTPSYRALFFHGNGGDMKAFFPIQQWLSSIGIGSYSYDYRGFGRSTGWPNEERLYADSAQVLDLILNEDKVALASLVFVGNSLGCGPAAELASRHEPAALLLLSPFTSLDEIVRRSPVLGTIRRFLWWHFPVIHFVSMLKTSPLIVVHGMQDGIIPTELGKEVSEGYRGMGVVRFIPVDGAGHNDLFFKSKAQMTAELDMLGLTAGSKNRPDAASVHAIQVPPEPEAVYGAGAQFSLPGNK